MGLKTLSRVNEDLAAAKPEPESKKKEKVDSGRVLMIFTAMARRGYIKGKCATAVAPSEKGQLGITNYWGRDAGSRQKRAVENIYWIPMSKVF